MGKVLQVPSDSLFADRPLVSGKESRFGGIHSLREGAVRPDDLDLVARGDEGALRRVIGQYARFVYRVALGITGCAADAEDVSQEVFIALPELLHSYDDGCFIAWLKVVASRKALMLLRAEERQNGYEILPPDTSRLEERTLNGIVIEKALGRLDPRLRTAFLLREVEGFSHREIAEIMDISVNLSQVRVFRARGTLRRLLSA